MLGVRDNKSLSSRRLHERLALNQILSKDKVGWETARFSFSEKVVRPSGFYRKERTLPYSVLKRKCGKFVNVAFLCLCPLMYHPCPDTGLAYDLLWLMGKWQAWHKQKLKKHLHTRLTLFCCSRESYNYYQADEQARLACWTMKTNVNRSLRQS